MKVVTRVLVLLLFTASSLMAAENTGRYERLGSKIMCTCGCGQMLLQCNHIGCPNSATMIRQLHEQVDATAATNDDDTVLNFFRTQWGVTTVVEPNRHGFELIAWILPFAGLGLGMFLVVVVVYRWHGSPAAAAGDAEIKLDPHLQALRERARKETEI